MRCGVAEQTLPVQPVVAEILASSEVWDMTLPLVEKLWRVETLARFKSAGFTFVSATVEDFPASYEGVLYYIERVKALVEANTSWLTLGNSLEDIDQGRREGKLVIGLNVQDAAPLGLDLSRLEKLHTVGVRHMVLAYNIRNFVADGCAEPTDAGLSNFGRQLIREMNRVGMIIDCSHTGRRSSLEAIELSERPVIFSHSNVYALCSHIRNIRDDQMRACAARGGVIGIVGIGSFLGERSVRPENMFRHIDYVASMVGSEHVGLSSDFVELPVPIDGLQPIIAGTKPVPQKITWPNDSIVWPDPTGTQIPLKESGCFQPEQLAELVQVMIAHGYPGKAIKGILGGNFRRVYAAVF